MPDDDPSTLNLFTVCLPGLEPLLADELRALGAGGVTPMPGGVQAVGNLATVYRVNLESGIASHVLLRVADFGARSLADLDRRGARIDWTRYLGPGTKTRVKATCRRSRIYHSGAAEERIARHLAQQLGGSAGSDHDDAAPIAVRVRIQDNRCTVSLDTSGAPLHRRGWRTDPGPAPLREDLAHALLLVVGQQDGGAVLDPMMGSGTILIEAACRARRLAPGRLRRFAIEELALHDADLLEAIRSRAAGHALDRAPAPILGSDRNPEAIARCRANAARAGVLDDLRLREATVSTALDGIDELPPRGILVANPPHGKRLGDPRELGPLYRAIGELARRLPVAWRVGLAVTDRRLALRSGLPLESAFLADSGGVKIRAMTAPVAARD